jgi:hypothetical protein
MLGELRRIAIAFFILSLPLAVRAQEASQPEKIVFSGQLRERTEFDDRHINADELVFIHYLRTRLRATAKPATGFTVVAEVQDSRYLGQNDPTQARGTTDISADGLDMHQAWAQIERPFDLPIDLRVGRQEITFGNERVIGVSNWSNTGRTFDGARATLHTTDLSVDLFGARLAASSAGPIAAQHLYGLWANWKPATTTSFDLFGLQDDNTTSIRRGEDSGKALLMRYSIGLTVKQTFGPIDMELEGIGQTGNTAPNDSVVQRSIKAFLGSAAVSVMLVPESKTKLNLLATTLSGDGSAKDDKSETFNTVFGTNHKFYGIADYVPELAGDRGLVDFMGGASTSPSKELKLALEGHLLLPQHGPDSFGNEFNITAAWRAATPFELSGGVAVFLPGEILKPRVGDSTRYWAYIAGLWEF